MNQLLLNDFGFRKGYYIHNMKQNRKKVSTAEQRLQTEINDYPLKEFRCSISSKIWENKLIHHEKCFYYYCKGAWDFNRKL